MAEQFTFPFDRRKAISIIGDGASRIPKVRKPKPPSDKPELKLRFTYQRVRTLQAMRVLLKSFKNETHLFRFVSIAHAPQHNHRPKGVVKGSPEHLLFLFLATLIIYRSVSDQGFKQAVLLYENEPWLFTKVILSKTLEDVTLAMKKIGFIHPWEAARNWHKTAETLFREYDGDPVQLLRSIKSIDDFLALKKQATGKRFPGYGPKLFSLLILFYQELGIHEAFRVQEAFPVDLHVQRIFLSLGLVSFNREWIDAVTLSEFIRKKISALCEQEKMHVVELSHALWFLGNRLCGNCQRISDIPLQCPLFKLCGGALSSVPYRFWGEWDMRYGRKTKGASPGQESFPFLIEVFGLKRKES